MKKRIVLLVGVVVLELEQTTDEDGATGYVAEVSDAVAVAATHYPDRGAWRVAVFSLHRDGGASAIDHETAPHAQLAAQALSGAAIEAVQLARAA
jgi:hypothetical protein